MVLQILRDLRIALNSAGFSSVHFSSNNQVDLTAGTWIDLAISSCNFDQGDYNPLFSRVKYSLIVQIFHSEDLDYLEALQKTEEIIKVIIKAKRNEIIPVSWEAATGQVKGSFMEFYKVTFEIAEGFVYGN